MQKPRVTRLVDTWGVKIPWDEQADAEAVVVEKLGGEVRDDRDPGGGVEQVRDFHLETDGIGIAFEVTRYTEPLQEATLSTVDKLDWRFIDLGFDWYLGMRPSYDVKRLHRSIGALLVRVEATGVIDERLVYDDDPPSEFGGDLVDALRALGVKYLRRDDAAGSGGGVVSPNPTGGAGATGPSALVELAEREAGESGNLLKLEAATAEERHLFIWVDTKQTTTYAAFSFGLPGESPVLPECVDAVWLVEAVRPTARVWQYHRAHGWRDLDRWRSSI